MIDTFRSFADPSGPLNRKVGTICARFNALHKTFPSDSQLDHKWLRRPRSRCDCRNRAQRRGKTRLPC